MMWQDLIDDAKEEGRQEGLQEGHQKGLREGRQDLLKEMLSSMGTLPDEVVQRIDQEKSLDQISAWARLAMDAENLEDFISRM